MLTRSNQIASQDQYYADSLLTKPTFSHSVFSNLAAGFATPVVALNMLDSQFSKKPEGQAILSALDSIRLENETPSIGTGQWLASEGANMLGFGLNPLTWGLGEVSSLATKGISTGVARISPDAASVFMRKPISDLVSKPIGKYIPEMYGKGVGEKPLSLGLVSEKTLQTFGIFAGVGVPQGIVDNFNQDTNHIAWGGVAREAGEMGAFGLAIGSIPFAWGVLRGKINRALGKDVAEAIDHSNLDKALSDGQITKAEHQWYSDYLEYQKNPSNETMAKDLQDRGSVIANENGHRANTVSNEVLFEILTPEDVSNLHGAIADQLSGNVPEEYRKSLSDFIIHNRMDYIRQNPKWLDGVRGYVDFINQKFDIKNTKLLEANKILDEYMLKGVKENMPFSQKEMFRTMKKMGFESSHMQHLPMTIPENMTQHLKIAERINQLKAKLKESKKVGKPENKQTMRRIAELEKRLPKILTPKEELTQLRQTLIGEKGLPPNWERSNAYHRLVDLSHVWHNARTLLDRVHLEREYNRQTAFRDLAHQTLRISDSDIARISKPDDVIDYLKKRSEGILSKIEPISKIEKEIKDYRDIPMESDTILDEQTEQIKNTQAENSKEEFTKSSDRFKEFKESENIFKNLISCVMGGLNG